MDFLHIAASTYALRGNGPVAQYAAENKIPGEREELEACLASQVPGPYMERIGKYWLDTFPLLTITRAVKST